ncbi:MAG: hypothetical protein ACTHMJ_17650 [Thermomicrobiales bacterium]|jgi:hypothetical protein|nr:hypothetical protein [Thermomicrobiales bacterium]
MHTPLLNEELAALRCAERQQQAEHNWLVEQALADTRWPRRPARGLTRLPRRLAFRAAWWLAHFAGAESGSYTVIERATLVDARGHLRTVCPDERVVVLVPRSGRDAA